MMWPALVLILTSSVLLLAQPGELPQFDAASVKPRPPGMGPGPMREPKGGIDYAGASLLNLIRRAYGVEVMQIKGPSWLSTEFYQIQAKMPLDTPLPRMQLMLQRLLAQRFRLQVHREKKKFAGYRLVVGKRGSKLKRSEGSLSYGMPRDASGRHVRGTITMPLFASVLSSLLERPVSDATKLAGLFEIDLNYSLGEESPAPSLVTAVPEQLGLRLEPIKAKLDVIVVDNVERVPTEN